MNGDLHTIGTLLLITALLLVMAGAGWGRLAVTLVVSLVIASLAAAGAGWVVYRVGLSFEHGGGEWRGLGSLVVAAFATFGVFVICFLLTMILLAVGRKIFRRASASRPLLTMGAVALVAGLGAFVWSTPANTSSAHLVQQLVAGASTDIEEELVRRGSAALPSILAELHRHPYSKADNYAPSQVPPLLRVLGRIGGAKAKAELRKWAECDGDEGIRVAAVRALATQGDRDVVPLIVEFLGKKEGQWPWHYRELLKALGQLKANDQVATIRDIVAAQPPFTQTQVTTEGVAALVAIGTGDAWAALAELSTHKEPSRRSDVITDLQQFPDARTAAILAKALDDPEARVRESAYWSLLRVEPKLNSLTPPPWSEANAVKMRAALKTLEPQKP